MIILDLNLVCCFLMNSLEEKKYVARGLKTWQDKIINAIRANNLDSPAAVPGIPMLSEIPRFGANVCSDPAVERRFGSIDYLVMLHFHQMAPQIYRFFTRDLLLQTE